MKTADFIREHRACEQGADWALSVSPNMSAVWDELVKQGKHEWLLWTVTQPGVFPDSVLRKLACRFVRETPSSDGRKVWDLLTDERSRKAVEIAECYAAGKATNGELVDAVYYAAYYAASVVAVYAPAYFAADAADAADARVGARDAALSAQVRMVAELGNPFKK